MMKRLLSFCCALLMTTVAWAGDAYLPGTEDVPLMTGLTVDKTDNLDFDTPAGQIAVLEVTARQLTAEQVFDYYRKILPALGWSEQKTGVFTRDNDSLTLVVVRAGASLIMRFEIALSSGI